MADAPPQDGQVFVVRYPFVWGEYQEMDAEGPVTMKTWKPGHDVDPRYDGDVEAVADGVGSMRLTVVSVHKPGRFPTRVFFTRRFVDPDGREFGKGKLHIASTEKFRRLSTRYAIDFDVRKPR